MDLADSALNAPQAAFGEHEFYPTIRDKAAVLLCRLVRNHPLPDGNKRAGWASLTLFLDLNGYQWTPEPPDVPSTEAVIVSIAAGAVSEDDVARWISQHIRAVDT